MTIDTICDACINAVRVAGYNESTVSNYEGVTRRFKRFCKERNVTEYSCEIGKSYAENVISVKTGTFSSNRYYSQGRFIRLINSFFLTGTFDFSIQKKNRIVPNNPYHKITYKKYQKYLHSIYDNKNTVHFYEYGMYCLLQFLNKIGIDNINDLQTFMIMQYIQETKQNRQREILCELRNIFRYLARNDLTNSIAGIHAPRINKIIPTLSDSEIQNIYNAISDGKVSLRDAAIVITGLSCGIRACDLINLKLTDIDWHNETISFKQSKTGNLVCLPLTTNVGNALAKYIVEERPKSNDNHLFLRSLAPFISLVDHASCYAIVSKVFNAARIEKGTRIFGMHMLRHNTASTMVKNGVPLQTIAAILGHSTPDTTNIYITTDVKSLKDCVLSLDGISKEVNP